MLEPGMCSIRSVISAVQYLPTEVGPVAHHSLQHSLRLCLRNALLPSSQFDQHAPFSLKLVPLVWSCVQGETLLCVRCSLQHASHIRPLHWLKSPTKQRTVPLCACSEHTSLVAPYSQSPYWIMISLPMNGIANTRRACAIANFSEVEPSANHAAKRARTLHWVGGCCRDLRTIAASKANLSFDCSIRPQRRTQLHVSNARACRQDSITLLRTQATHIGRSCGLHDQGESYIA